MIEEVLEKIARQVMALDEETLTALVPKYKARMNEFAPTQQWEEAVIIYFLINGLRNKNTLFNDKIKDYMLTGQDGRVSGPHIRPRLRLIKHQDGEHGNPLSGSPAGEPEKD